MPILLKAFQHVPPLQIVSHRVVWACVLFLGWLFAGARWRLFRGALSFGALRTYGFAAVLINVNWLVC